MPHPQTRCGSARPAATSSPSLTVSGPATRSRTYQPPVADWALGYLLPLALNLPRRIAPWWR
jgi:hypothetical protein